MECTMRCVNVHTTGENREVLNQLCLNIFQSNDLTVSVMYLILLLNASEQNLNGQRLSALWLKNLPQSVYVC